MAIKTKKRRRNRRERRIVPIALAVTVLAAIGVLVYSLLTPDYRLENENDPVATVILANGDKIIVELFPDAAPETVWNFIQLANSGYYDGLGFHKIVTNQRVQTGLGEDRPAIRGEFSRNGVDNPISHTRGTLSMARLTGYDTAKTQFFICLGDQSYFDGAYAAFGRVVKGMEYVDKIAQSSENGLKIKTIRVDAKEFTYQAQAK